MKVDYTDVSDTHKSLVVEIPTDVVEHEIARVARDYARQAKLPGFRPGKIPAKVVRQRFKHQILSDVAQDLVPRTIDGVLQERGVEPVDTPKVKVDQIDEGLPLKFTAEVETAPPVDPGDLSTITLRRTAVSVTDEQVTATIERLRGAQARFEPVEDRGAEIGDSVVLNMTRQRIAGEGEEAAAAENLENVGVDLGAESNPPGFDAEIVGLSPTHAKTFRVTFPKEYPVETLAGAEVEYAVTVQQVRRKVLPALDDEFAKDLGYGSLDELQTTVRERLQREAGRTQEREMRQDLLKQLAQRVTATAPESLVAREVDRRVEEFVHQLVEQGVDPRQMQIDWDEMRKSQRETAEETVKCALLLDEVARRESLKVEDHEIEAEVQRFAERSGQPAAAVRERLAREGAIARIYTGLRREKAIDYALSRATIADL
jgi:trigger factor